MAVRRVLIIGDDIKSTDVARAVALVREYTTAGYLTRKPGRYVGYCAAGHPDAVVWHTASQITVRFCDAIAKGVA